MKIIKILLIGIVLFVVWVFKPVILSYFNSDTQTIYDNTTDSSKYEKELYDHKQLDQTINQGSSSPLKIFRCDGRQHCSQMNSYEEAKYFLKHCPNPKMDGDNDGIPCEQQFGRYH